VVEDQRQDETNESPYTAEETNVSPGTSRCDQLGVEHTGAERNNSEDQGCYVGSSLSGWSQFGCDRQRRQLVDTSSCTSNGHASDECVHSVSCGGDNITENEEKGAKESDIATSKEIRKGPDERAHGSESEKVAQDEPSPSVYSTNVTVDVAIRRQFMCQNLNRFLHTVEWLRRDIRESAILSIKMPLQPEL
jgi:hypothetical protein